MILMLSAQDLRELNVGWLSEEGRLAHEAHVTTPPEGFLVSLHTLLQEWRVKWPDLKRVVVVTGPGSFTSTRLIVSIANTIGFVKQIPVIGMANPERKTLKALVKDKKRLVSWLDGKPGVFAMVAYAEAPHVTKSRKWWTLGKGPPAPSL